MHAGGFANRGLLGPGGQKGKALTQEEVRGAAQAEDVSAFRTHEKFDGGVLLQRRVRETACDAFLHHVHLSFKVAFGGGLFVVLRQVVVVWAPSARPCP